MIRPNIVIPNEVRNPFFFVAQEERDSSARSVTRFTVNVHRERNDNISDLASNSKIGRSMLRKFRRGR